MHMSYLSRFLSLTLLILSIITQSYGAACPASVCQEAELLEALSLDERHCITACLSDEMSGHLDRTSSCPGSPFGTVWIAIPDTGMDLVFTAELSADDISDLQITLYKGGCSALEALDCNQGRQAYTFLRNILLPAGQSHWLALSTTDGSSGELELCYELNAEANSCNKVNKVEVMSTSMGSPLTGPFQQGEDVEVCYTITGYENISCNYLHGIIPSFGEGWDESSFTQDGAPRQVSSPLVTQGNTSFTTANPICEGDPSGTWEWFGQGDISYNLNSTNTLDLRHGDMIPAGWVFVNSFDPSCFDFDDACCTNPDPNPNNGYGDDDYPLCGRGLTQEWQVCFVLTTDRDCSSNGDCTVGFKTFSDGELGAYISNACASDRIAYLNASVACCVKPQLSTTVQAFEVCPDEAFNLELSADRSAGIYYYDPAGELQLISGQNEQISVSDSIQAAGTYTYEFYAADGCDSDELIIEVTIVEELTADIVQTPAHVCPGEPVTLEVVSTSASLSDWAIVWNDDPLSTGTTFQTSELDGTVGVTLNHNGCSTAISTTLRTYPQSEAFLSGSTQICPGDRAFVELTVAGAAPFKVEITSDFGEIMLVEFSDATYLSEIFPTQSTSYVITSAVDANGCTMDVEGLLEVMVSEDPEYDLAGTDIACDNPGVITIEGIETMDGFRVEWRDDEGTLISQDELMMVVQEAGVYSVRVEDVATGCSTESEYIVDEAPGLDLQVLTGEELSLPEGQSLTIELWVNLDPADIVSVTWQGDIGTLSCTDCLNPVAQPQNDVVYQVEVMDKNGCSEVKNIVVDVTGERERFYIPTIFNPTQSGEDASFCVLHDGDVSRISVFNIYDRWGNLVFTSEDQAEVCWDGRLSGRLLEQGVYLYDILLVTASERTLRHSGTVTLVH